MKIKTLIAILSAFLISVTVTSCDNKTESATETTATTEATATTATEATATENAVEKTADKVEAVSDKAAE